MKITLPHWASLALIAAGGAIEALSGSFPAYSVLLKAGGGVLITLGATGVLSLPAAGPLAARFAKKGIT
jgi:hypothetical protein